MNMSVQGNSVNATSKAFGVDTSEMSVESLVMLAMTNRTNVMYDKQKTAVTEMQLKNQQAKELNSQYAELTAMKGKFNAGAKGTDELSSSDSMKDTTKKADQDKVSAAIDGKPVSEWAAAVQASNIAEPAKAQFVKNAELGAYMVSEGLVPKDGASFKDGMAVAKGDIQLSEIEGAIAKTKAKMDNLGTESSLQQIKLQQLIGQTDTAVTGLSSVIKTFNDQAKSVVQKF